jgi:transposase-like protein
MSSIARPPHQKTLEELEIFELIAKVIQSPKDVARIAKLYGCSEQTVRKWRNDPAADDDNKADPHGRRSPVDNLLQFLDALNAIDPARVEMVWDRLEYEIADMQGIQGNAAKMRIWKKLKEANQLARQLAAVTDVNGSNDDG